ncbi:kinase-like domain-containing protein [Boeremia exigua]|uniref:kinase-like domain-containing protein n=1 Tax=Boeremia exigua TaxID=749465 RepID=UPI001E8D6DCA|nr:kinase-like domain-containing protein [Boeremia exigua]KAH6637570.1 kinase-like domain-containing protein [Boeremia exigua]
MASPPTTPGPEIPECSEDWRFEETGAPCEWVEEYRPGGLHPVSLGDTFCEGKYKVIRKLGAGCSSTIWLVICEGNNLYSPPTYVALKITTAKSTITSTELTVLDHLLAAADDYPNSRHVTRLLDRFTHQGPNGIHQCLVFEVMDIESLDPQELKQDEAKTAVPVQRIDGKNDLWAPKNLYLKQSLHQHVQLGQDICVKLSDFGAAFFTGNPPAKAITPIALRAPELILNQPFSSGIGTGIDMWSFGCLVYEFLTGSKLFTVMMFGFDQEDVDGADDEHLLQLNDIIRPLPEAMMRAWPRSSVWYDAEHNLLQPDEAAVEDSGGEEAAAERVGLDDGVDNGLPYIYDSLETRFAKKKHPDIDDEEAAVICQLIREVLMYDPAERATAEQLLKHPWFLE